MADYNRTVWKDHIKDQNGNVLQQGTPVSAKNLNNIENQLVILSAKENTLAELIRETIPSGFTSLSDLDYSYMATNPNTIRLLSDSVAFVNGYKVVIQAGTIIQLDAPPTSGSRDDLVFLECWKQQDANGSVSWNYRIRIVDGVDFTLHPEGLKRYGESWGTSVTIQGALSSPIATPTFYNTFCDYKENGISTDIGLFKNNSTASGVSIDGYVYAIPMFRIHRRNSSGYGVTNGNGANAYYATPVVTMVDGSTGFLQGSQGSTKQIQTSDTSMLNVGDYLVRADQDVNASVASMQVVSIDNSTSFTVRNVAYSLNGSLYNNGFKLKSYPSRKDKTYNNIVDIRDIIDLRHQVSLTGFNYQELLEENFDKLLRGVLQTSAKTQILKTYHGIPKTPIDANTIFYASLDGTTTAEVGGALSLGSGSFKPTPTGLGYKFNGDSVTALTMNALSKDTGTIDFILNTSELNSEANNYPVIVGLASADNLACFSAAINKSANALYCWEAYSDNSIVMTDSINVSKYDKFIHVRFSWDINNIYLWINGSIIYTKARGANSLRRVPAKICIGGNYAYQTSGSYTNQCTKSTISDVSISNINRGSTFATLPQDFIDGYARISSAFNEQRNVFSDALTTETDFVQVKCSGVNGKAIALGDATDWAKDDGTKWNTGDRVKVKGLCGEIITGVIDGDTALAMILAADGTAIMTLNDVSKLSVGDSVQLYSPANPGAVWASTVQSIIGNTVTFANTLSSAYIGSYLIETTASTSSPKVQYFNGSNLVDVTGTWSGLGTNEATFTLGTNSSLTNQDLYITYGLNEIPGQGGISEVLTATLAGESNGKKLTVNPLAHVRDDFAGKISGSVNINPNIAKQNSSASMLTPSSGWNEFSQNQYGYINAQDFITTSISTSVNGQIPQNIFSFNLIRILEDKFGPLPCGSDTASKVLWLKANISKIACLWFGYGSCSGGNKAYLTPYLNNTWQSDTSKNTSNTATGTAYTLSMTYSSGYKPSEAIDSNGFVHFLVYTDASDGTTASVINTDYVDIEVALNIPGNYDILAPENPRRDDGKSNILLIRKETKEIQTMFSRGNNDGIVTYGDYIPYQGGNYVLDRPMKFIQWGESVILTTSGTGGAYMCQHQDSGALYNIELLHALPAANNDSNYINNNIVYNDMLYNTVSVPLTMAEKRIKKSKDGDARTGTFIIPSWSIKTIRGRSGMQPTATGTSYAEYIIFRFSKIANVKLRSIACCIVLDIVTNELLLLVNTEAISAGSPITNGFVLTNATSLDIFKISNRPLIK